MDKRPLVVLGLHKDPWHDTGAALICEDEKGFRIACVAEERLNRKKNSNSFPELSIKACMKELNVNNFESIDYIVLDYIKNKSDWTKDYVKNPCKIDTFLASFPKNRIFIVNHHLLHACATFFSSGFKKAAILVVDGRGSDGETQSLFKGDGSTIKLIETTNKIGIGLLYSAVTQAIGFKKFEEGKTMGLAPYGARCVGRLFDFKAKFEGISTDYSRFCVEGSYDLAEDHAPLRTFKEKAKAAFEVQQECEKAMVYLANYSASRTKEEKLCLSGGVALNSVANDLIRLNKDFKEIFINPAASDTGIALGAALYGYHILAKKPRLDFELSAFLGPEYPDSHILKEIKRQRALQKNPFIVQDDPNYEIAAKLLAENNIVACFQGRSEIGPRALGNRSILMSPMGDENKDRLNARVKFRESFRPFAPACLEEKANEYFSIDRESPYMLFICKVKPEKKSLLPAITHVDGTARLQTLNKKRNREFYKLVEEFSKLTSLPVLLNTSFNIAGEPIVETPKDAIRCFLKTDIDALLISNFILLKDSCLKKNSKSSKPKN